MIFTYEIKYNGEVVEESYTTINLSENPEEENELYKGVKAALLGAKKDDKGMYPTNISAYKSYTYFQSFMDFTTYEIKSIDYFVEQKEIAAFKYISTDNVDNYLGGIIHINNLPEGSEYSSYDLDMESCDRVIKILSGTLPGGSSTSFDGLAGSKVVAVGLTPDVMKEFGLYEYTIYYELPRYYDLDEDTYKATVGFTLYISKNKDGIRYVGSDMFDIVVEIEQSKFDFVEKSFVEFWASRDIAMIDQTLVENLTVNFNLESFKGKYSFMVDHPEVWMVTYADPSSPTGQKTFRVYEEPANDTPGLISKQRYDAASIVNVAVSGDNVTETLLVKLLKESGHEYINIHETYYYRGYEQQSIGFDYLGEAYFRDVLYAIYSTGYSGILAEGEADRAREREAVMSLSFGVTGSNRNIVYNFYYTEYGRVAVEINDGANKPCHFYVTNHAFKGIVNAIYDLVNGNIVEINAGYKN